MAAGIIDPTKVRAFWRYVWTMQRLLRSDNEGRGMGNTVAVLLRGRTFQYNCDSTMLIDMV